MATATASNDASLGKEIFRCRTASRATAWTKLGGSWLALIFVPFIYSFVAVAFMAGIGGALGLNESHPLIFRAALTFALLAAPVAGLIWTFSSPDIPLTIHENGVRYEENYIPFANLQTIFIGKNHTSTTSDLQEFTRFLGKFHVGMIRVSNTLQKSIDSTVTLQLRDQSSVVLKNVLAAFKFEDVNSFLNSIKERNPLVAFI